MSFLTFESSEQSGAPVEYYRFTMGPDIFRMTSADEPVTAPDTAELYPCVEISRTKVVQSREEASQRVQIKLPRTHLLPQKFTQFIPATALDVTVYRYHLTDSEPRVQWKGRVRLISFQGDWAIMETESALAAIQRNGLQRKYQNPCNHMLYITTNGIGCPVSKALHKTPAVITAINGATLTLSGISGLITDWLKAGYCELTDGSDNRSIAAHTAPATIILNRPFLPTQVSIGTPLNVFDGCDHLFSTCRGKFGDETTQGEFYGGFPTVPLINIFQTGLK